MSWKLYLLFAALAVANYTFYQSATTGEALGPQILPYNEEQMRTACDANITCCGFTTRGSLRANCGEITPTPPFGGESLWIKDNYCSGGNQLLGDSNLGRVALTGENGTSIDDETDCPGGTGVQDFTNLQASLLPGGNYALNFQVTTCDTGWPRLAYAFIDFNGNGVYDPSELLGEVAVDNRLPPFDAVFNFAVPCLSTGAVAGLTRMRVLVVESGFGTDPCVSFPYGGVKEFSINILNQDCIPSKYCKAGNTVAQGSNLGPVSLVGELQTAISDTTDCPGSTGVRDFTKLQVSLLPGRTYVLDFDATTCGGKGYPRLAYAYIDFNNNQIYESDELVGANNVGSDSAPVDVRFKVYVPPTAVYGPTRMRVLVAEGAHDADPCLVFSYGGVKEFTVLILGREPNLPFEVVPPAPVN